MNAWWRALPSKRGEKMWPCFVGLLTIPIVGMANYRAGNDISFLIFYLPWIGLVGWVGGSLVGALAAILASVAWLIADLHSTQSEVPIAYWNFGMRTVVFILCGLLFAVLRQTQSHLENVVAATTSQLQEEITERARIQREVAEICAAQQRQIAYDLHDGLGQHISGVAFKTKLLEQKLRAEGSVQADEAARITALMNDALRQTRLVSRTLEATYGEAHGLKEAIIKLGDEVRESFQISVVIRADEWHEGVGAPIDLQLFRIAQEAIRNATTHGAARELTIELSSNSHEIQMKIRDNGSGFDKTIPREGMGMRTMKYRSQMIGGSLAIDSRVGAGTTVACRVPKAPLHPDAMKIA